MNHENKKFIAAQRTSYTPLKLLALVLVSALLTLVVAINSTPGQFGYADIDGCACSVTYTTQASQGVCEAARSRQCDGPRMDRLLLLLSYLDLHT